MAKSISKSFDGKAVLKKIDINLYNNKFFNNDKWIKFILKYGDNELKYNNQSNYFYTQRETEEYKIDTPEELNSMFKSNKNENKIYM